MKTDGHYTVYPVDRGQAAFSSVRHRRILSIGCNHCSYAVALSRFSRSKYGHRIAAHGRGRYNAARGAVIKHLHTEHRDKLTK